MGVIVCRQGCFGYSQCSTSLERLGISERKYGFRWVVNPAIYSTIDPLGVFLTRFERPRRRLDFPRRSLVGCAMVLYVLVIKFSPSRERFIESIYLSISIYTRNRQTGPTMRPNYSRTETESLPNNQWPLELGSDRRLHRHVGRICRSVYRLTGRAYRGASWASYSWIAGKGSMRVLWYFHRASRR